MSCGCHKSSGVVATVKAGVAGLTQAALMPSRHASSPMIANRRQACKICPSNKWGVCDVCHCLIPAKTVLATETCPLGKWSQAASK